MRAAPLIVAPPVRSGHDAKHDHTTVTGPAFATRVERRIVTVEIEFTFGRDITATEAVSQAVGSASNVEEAIITKVNMHTIRAMRPDRPAPARPVTAT